jgi:hypothetical protein
MDSTLRRSAPAEIADAARQRSGADADYLEAVRASLARLATPDVRGDDVRGALASVERHADVDPDPPLVSRRLYARVSRTAFRRLTGWDLRYLGAQVTVLGHALVRFGTAMVERAEGLDATTAQLRDEVAALSARLERLEGEIARR